MNPQIIYNSLYNGKRLVSAQPVGVCSRQIDLVLNNDTIEEIRITGGCHGNSQGLTALLRGMKVDDAIARLDGIDCNGKGTSCPDQVARLLKMITRH